MTPADSLFHEVHGKCPVIRGNKGNSFALGTPLLGAGKVGLASETENSPCTHDNNVAFLGPFPFGKHFL